ncbi:MAG: glycosyltransferase [Planctomycetes bacterium]|nr:glycosyltransferase [Planctomycetota bacterium]
MRSPGEVLLVVDKMPRAGTQLHVATLARGLAVRGQPVRVVCLLEGGDLAEELRSEGLPVESLDLSARPVASRLPTAVLGLRRIAARQRPWVLQGHLYFANLACVLAGGLLGGGVRVYTGHRQCERVREPRAALGRRLIHRLGCRAVANAQAVARHLVASEGADPARVAVIPNGIDAARFRQPPGTRERVRRSLGIPTGSPVAIQVANLNAGKGHRDLLEAAARVVVRGPRLHLLLVGEGPEAESLRRLAEGLGIGASVHLLGSRRDVPALLAAADLAVLSSHTEGFSNALLEYAAAGLPALATRVGGNAEVVVEAETGLLVPPRDPAALAGALGGLLADPPRLRALGEAARGRAEGCFSVEALVERTLTLYGSAGRREVAA